MDDYRIVELYLLRDETAIKQTTEKYGSRLRSLAYAQVNFSKTPSKAKKEGWLRWFESTWYLFGIYENRIKK